MMGLVIGDAGASRNGGPDEAARAALLAALRRPWEPPPGPVSVGREAVELARRLELLPFLATRAAGADPDAAAGLRAARLAALAAEATARVELREAQEALRAAGVLAVAIKGPALAAQGWPAGARVSADLDLWLPHPEDWDRAVVALARLGLAPDEPRAPSALEGDRALHGPGRLTLDLHVALVKPSLRAGAPGPGFEALRETPLGLTLDPAWTLALAVVHLHQDLLAPRRLVDLALLRGRAPAETLARADAHVAALGLAGVAAHGAWLARALLDAPGPDRPPRVGLARRRLLATLSAAGRWTRPAPWLDAPDDAAALQRTLAQLLLFDDAAWALPASLLRHAFPARDYTARRGGALRRLARLGPRLLRALRDRGEV